MAKHDMGKKSIQGWTPTPHPMVTDPPPANSTVMPAPRKKLDSEFNDEENKLEMADTQAEIHPSQGTMDIQPHLCSRSILILAKPRAFMQKDLSRKQEKSTSIIANLLSGFQKQFPPTNNQLRTSSNSKTHATVFEEKGDTHKTEEEKGHCVAAVYRKPRERMDSQYFKDKALLLEAKSRFMAKRAQPALYDAETFDLTQSHPLVYGIVQRDWFQQVVSMKKDDREKIRARSTANGFYEKLNALMLFLNRNMFSEQAYGLLPMHV
ncbi:hypothetical protein Tco_0581096 [Tanacetum coccineum]